MLLNCDRGRSSFVDRKFRCESWKISALFGEESDQCCICRWLRRRESLVWSGVDLAKSKKLSRKQDISIQAVEGEGKVIRRSGKEARSTRQSRAGPLGCIGSLERLAKVQSNATSLSQILENREPSLVSSLTWEHELRRGWSLSVALPSDQESGWYLFVGRQSRNIAEILAQKKDWEHLFDKARGFSPRDCGHSETVRQRKQRRC